MKRLVIIVDSLRFDCSRLLGLKRPYWCFQVLSYANGTLAAFREISRHIQQHKGSKIIFTGGGYPEMAKWADDVELIDNKMFPLREMGDLIRQKIAGSPAKTLLIVHDYWLHNYWEDVCPEHKPCYWWKSPPDKKKLKEAYYKRTSQTGEMIEKLRADMPEGWNMYITADHGELFWEDGKSYGHGPGAGESLLVYHIPVIGLDDSPMLNYTQLWTGRLS